MRSSAEYLVVAGSLRGSSRSRVLAAHLLSFYESKGVTCQLLDLRETDLPLCDGEEAYSQLAVQACSKLVDAARVIVVATPIYNFDVSAAVKNLVELTGDAWEGKIVGFLCAAGGDASYMAPMSFANSLMLDFQCLIIPRFVYATSEDFRDGRLHSQGVKDRIEQLGDCSLAIRNA
jgi:NAD(P)H-dependent FMN reductase